MAGKNTETKTEENKSPVAPATEFDPSGAPIQTVADVDPSHPAVDDNPRANTSEEQNRIDFDDPTMDGSEAVAKNLGLKSEEKGK